MTHRTYDQELGPPEGDAAPQSHGASANRSDVQQNSTPDDIQKFASVLFKPDDIVEVRALRGKGEAQSEWCKAAELGDPASGIRLWIARHVAATWNIYVGANPRTRHGGTKAEDVALARAHFVDFDGINPDEARERIAAAGLPPPTLLIASGHGCHAYWVLAEPVTDLGRWTGVQKRLIARLGSDPVVHDPPRIMRLPGTTNWKKDPPVACTIVQVGAPGVTLNLEPVAPDERYLPSKKGGAPASGGSGGLGGRNASLSPCKATLKFMAFGANEGARNNALFKAACDLSGLGASFEEVCQHLVEPAQRSGLEDWEIERTIRSAFSKSRTPACPPTSDGLPSHLDMTRQASAATPGATPPSPVEGGEPPGESDAENGDEEKRRAQRDLIADLARERYRFSRSLEDEPFAVARDGPNLARMLRGGRYSLRAELARAFSLATGKAPSSSAMADAMQVLEGDCLAAEAEQVHIRLGRHGDAIVLDLGDAQGRAVFIDAAGWKVMERSPIVFRRTALIRAMPAPVRGGSLDLIKKKLNLSEAVWVLALGWLIASLTTPPARWACRADGSWRPPSAARSRSFAAGAVSGSTSATSRRTSPPTRRRGRPRRLMPTQ